MEPENMISNCISDSIPPQMKYLNMVIPILIQFFSFASNWSIANLIKLHIIQQNVILTSKLFCITNFQHYPSRSLYKIKCIRINILSWKCCLSLLHNIQSKHFSSPVDNQNDLELDFKVFFFADPFCSDIELDESNWCHSGIIEHFEILKMASKMAVSQLGS